MPKIFSKRKSKKSEESRIEPLPPRTIFNDPEEEVPDLPEDPFGASMPDVSSVALPNGTRPTGSLSAFGWTIFDSVGKGDVVFSPYGIYMALGMLANAAEPGSSTEAELLKALGSDSMDSLDSYLEDLLESVGESYKTRFCSDSLVLVSSTAAKGSGIDEDYRKRVAKYCRGAVVEEDIFGDLPGVKRKIKDWVKLKSFGMIPDYESQIEKGTLCDLLNVVYFKGAWESEFSEHRTSDKDFKNADGSISRVKMMHKTVPDVRFHSDERYRAIDLPYKMSSKRMCLILPRNHNSLDVLSSWKSETPEYREEFVCRLGSSMTVDAELSLPKLTMSASFGLGDILRMLGLESVLGGDARFTGVIEGVNLFFGSGRHQAKIKVDEKGTEAAAVTEMMMLGACPPMKEPKKVVFRCDIPFLFVIIDRNDDRYLFMGYAGNGEGFSDDS